MGHVAIIKNLSILSNHNFFEQILCFDEISECDKDNEVNPVTFLGIRWLK